MRAAAGAALGGGLAVGGATGARAEGGRAAALGVTKVRDLTGPGLTTAFRMNDGFVYVYSTGFQRNKPIILHRVRGDRLTDLAAYEPWGWRDGVWAWGHPPTPILEGAFGELCLRPLGGKWILTWFNAGDYRIDAIVMDTPTSNLYTAHRQTLIWGGAWGQEDDSHVAQLYGGFIIPGSTLNDLHLSVSQWNTEVNWPYRVMQHRVTGLWP
ncbi:hypothetical protein DEH69_05770 [Streptomyces sp. PT12]|nr:hypothetical protein DEH69_05770 [Streptomyces sp. PT12]